MIPNKLRRRLSRSRARLLIALVTAVTASAALVSPPPSTGATVTDAANGPDMTELLLAPATQATSTAQPDAASTAAPTTPPAKAQMIDGQATLSVDSLAPEVITSGQDLTVSGTIANGTGDALEGLSVTVQMEGSTEVTVTGLESWLAGERDSAMRSVHQGDLGESIASGEVKTFSVTIPADSLPLGDEQQWGPRGLEVTVSKGRTAVAQDRTLLVWDTGAKAGRSHVTTLIPVTASTGDLELLTTGAEPPADAALAGLRKRITSLLELAGDGVVLAVDPALLEALGVTRETVAAATPSPAPSPSPSATGDEAGDEESPAPTSSPDSSETPSASPSPGQSAGPSATASPSDSPSPSDKRPGQALTKTLVEAVAAGDVVALPWSDADIAALTHLGETDLLADAYSRTEGSQTVAAGAPASLAWPAGALDSATLDALPDSVQTVVTDPGDLPVEEDLTYTPSQVTSVGSRTVLTPDANLSDTLGGTLVTDESSTDLSSLDATQLLRAETAIMTRQAPALSRSVVVTLKRSDAAGIDTKALAERLKALRESSWTSPQGLSALTAEAAAQQDEGTKVHRADAPDWVVGDQEASAADLAAARATRDYLSSVTSILPDPQAAIGSASDVVARTASAAWRSDPPGRTSMAESARERGAAVTARLTAMPSRTINLIAAEANLPVRITSSLNQDATVVVRVLSGSARLQTIKDVILTVPADGQTTATVPVRAVGSGDVNLTIMLLANDGTAVGAPQTIHMRVHADWESRGTRVMGAGLVILLVGGIVRTVRRGRRTTAPHRVEEKT
ncbi:DUF6049 family protein [Actinomyces israelii]|uniref:DUF6049 family protein n=1 Tax=Actinomyces israelii TaxID=1659 RepID=UPI000B03A217|nr:DUF6049 family protein [Actinomyces israelii]